MTGLRLSRNISNTRSKVIKITFKKDIQTWTFQEFFLHFWDFFFNFCAQTYGWGSSRRNLSFDFWVPNLLLCGYEIFWFSSLPISPFLGQRLWVRGKLHICWSFIFVVLVCSSKKHIKPQAFFSKSVLKSKIYNLKKPTLISPAHVYMHKLSQR